MVAEGDEGGKSGVDSGAALELVARQDTAVCPDQNPPLLML